MWAEQSSRTPARQALVSGAIDFRNCSYTGAVTTQCDFRQLTILRKRVAWNTAIAGGVLLRFQLKSSIKASKAFAVSKTSPRFAIEGPAMMTILKGLWRKQSGDDVAEYALLVAMIALVVLVALFSFGTSNGKLISDAANSISSSASRAAGSSSAGGSRPGGSSQGGGGQPGGGGQGGGSGGGSGGSAGTIPTSPTPVK